MMLLTEAIRRQLPELYGQAGSSDPVLYAKFFTPGSGLTWFIAEGEPEGNYHGADFIFYGYVIGVPTWCRFKLSELQPLGASPLTVERDLEFETTRFSRLPLRYRPMMTAAR
jgi:hypothetical protein